MPVKTPNATPRRGVSRKHHSPQASGGNRGTRRRTSRGIAGRSRIAAARALHGDISSRFDAPIPAWRRPRRVAVESRYATPPRCPRTGPIRRGDRHSSSNFPALPGALVRSGRPPAIPRYGYGIAGGECFRERFVEQPFVVPIGARRVGQRESRRLRRPAGSTVRSLAHGSRPLAEKSFETRAARKFLWPGEVARHEVPVHQMPERIHVLRALVAVIDVIGVFRAALVGGDGFGAWPRPGRARARGELTHTSTEPPLRSHARARRLSEMLGMSSAGHAFRGSLRLLHSTADRPYGGLQPGPEAELLQEVLDVHLDGGLGDLEAACDELVGETLR